MESETKSSGLLYFFLGIAALILILFLLTPEQGGRSKARRISSNSNLKQIGLAIRQYAIDYIDHFPNQPGADGFRTLIEQGFLPDYILYISPMDQTTSKPKNGQFSESNTSYAYVGAGFKEGDFPEPGKIPLAFEKPWFDKGYMNILYMDGHVQSFEKMKFKTCVDVVEFCRKGNNPDAPYWQTLLSNARLIDKTKPK